MLSFKIGRSFYWMEREDDWRRRRRRKMKNHVLAD
jgi:hypothetical protein